MKVVKEANELVRLVRLYEAVSQVREVYTVNQTLSYKWMPGDDKNAETHAHRTAIECVRVFLSTILVLDASHSVVDETISILGI